MAWFPWISKMFGGVQAAAVTRSLTQDWEDEDFDELCSIAELCSKPGAICRPQFLLSIMWVEGKGARADAENPNSSATGIIQIMGTNIAPEGQTPVYRWFGYTRAQFKALGVRGQLPYAKRWFLPHKGYLKSIEAAYTAVFLPAFVKNVAMDETYVLCAEDSPSKQSQGWARANRYLDQNKDGRIQGWELGAAIKKELAQGGARCEELFARLRAAEARRAVQT